ncbi:MAG: UDP-glucose 4-epimerase [Solirubrobacteraceae bacterium]|nr:UDP-glucose 4-epimerase [Solirubrobacteraceae bacterium]
MTGGAGFIGSHVVDALAARGDRVTVLDDLSTGRRENVNALATLHEASIADPAAVGFGFEAARPELVFHLAAQVDVRRSVADPQHDLAVNVGGTINVLDAAREWGVRHLVFASTGGAIYGDTDVVPTPETAAERPLAPYGQAKLAAEGYLRLLGGLHGVPVTALRFANVYGPRQDPLGEGGVCAIFCGAAVAEQPVTVFGTGEQTRDFVFVADVVAACLAAAQEAAFGPYNVGTGVETSVLTLAERLGVAVEHADARPGEVERSCLDPARAAHELGWSAAVELADGLDRTLAWARAQS